jgi:hypothetical protein
MLSRKSPTVPALLRLRREAGSVKRDRLADAVAPNKLLAELERRQNLLFYHTSTPAFWSNRIPVWSLILPGASLTSASFDGVPE